MNYWKIGIGTTIFAALGALVYNIALEAKAAMSIEADFGFFKPLKIQTGGVGAEPKFKIETGGGQPRLLGQFGLKLKNNGEKKIKLSAVNLNFLYGAINIGTVTNDSKLSIEGKEKTFGFNTVLNISPFVKLLIDFFSTSKIPIQVVGSIKYFSTSLGAETEIPLKLSFDLKHSIKEYSPQYVKELFNVFDELKK